MIKTRKVVNKMAFQMFKSVNFRIFFAKLPLKVKSSATILKVRKRENLFENLNHIGFATRVASKTQKFF